QTVPTALGTAIRERQCLPLGEFYEIILKAIRADILLEPKTVLEPVKACEWNTTVRPRVLAKPIIVLFCAGIAMSLGFRPKVPTNPLDWAAGVVLLSATLSLGYFLKGCLIRGAGGEVYLPKWRWLALPPHFTVDTHDAIMLSTDDKTTVGIAGPAMLATATGIASWYKPEWAFVSLIGLVGSMRPIFGGRFVGLIHVGDKRAPSDAEYSHIFPPNRSPDGRIKMLRYALSQSTTWMRLLYGVFWTLAAMYLGARLGEIPPWTLAFWQHNGSRIAASIFGSLVALGAAYLSWEIYHLARERARARRNTVRLWQRRWFGGSESPLDESSRVKLLTQSPVTSALQPPQRQELARLMNPQKHGPWKNMPEYGDTPTEVALIVSGKVSVRREMPTGRTVQVQVLSEGDIIGLHDLADPKFPKYRFKTQTPVKLLMVDRATADKLIVRRVPQSTLTDMLLKAPFLRRISLCQNWHLQAINRFARLSSITSYEQGAAILSEGQTVEEFFVIFQGDAHVTKESQKMATIRSGEFFGEIGLMQNSSPNASVSANRDTRCLSIPRTELLRFVTHNYTVALELERVSSERLGRPIFPLRRGDFRSI
ncbi:MAG TPA: cyclic nucleotide-binding domain-containing protein, partial [Opitutaceae bacterium]